MAGGRFLVAVTGVIAALGTAVDVVPDGLLQVDAEADGNRGESDQNIGQVPCLLLEVGSLPRNRVGGSPDR